MSKVGLLITHGTDTLAWTHAFIRYSIKHNHANIVLTGSQIPMPSQGEFSDAYENLENSMRFMTTMVPPNIITVFNYGKEAFSDSLHKVHKWDNLAFVGDAVARMEWDEIKYHDSSIEICEPEPLEHFYLITTGGTIESEYDEEGLLVPGQNHVLGYLARRFSGFFKDLSQDPVFAIDSSDLTFERMCRVSDEVASCLRETNDEAFADLRFSRDVRIVYSDPFKQEEDYRAECEGARGVVLAGYGGGNVTIDQSTSQNLVPLIEELVRSETPVVLSSQVPLGPADFVYRNGYNPLKAGALSGVDLSLPECQVRLSYLVGHEKEIRAAALASGTGFPELLECLFMSGMKFRTQRSKRTYGAIRGTRLNKEDLLVNLTLEQAVAKLEEGFPQVSQN